jgi:hypothetical protein
MAERSEDTWDRDVSILESNVVDELIDAKENREDARYEESQKKVFEVRDAFYRYIRKKSQGKKIKNTKEFLECGVWVDGIGKRKQPPGKDDKKRYIELKRSNLVSLEK